MKIKHRQASWLEKKDAAHLKNMALDPWLSGEKMRNKNKKILFAVVLNCF